MPDSNHSPRYRLSTGGAAAIIPTPLVPGEKTWGGQGALAPDAPVNSQYPSIVPGPALEASPRQLLRGGVASGRQQVDRRFPDPSCLVLPPPYPFGGFGLKHRSSLRNCVVVWSSIGYSSEARNLPKDDYLGNLFSTLTLLHRPEFSAMET